MRLDTYLGLNGTVLDLAVLVRVSERGYVGLTAGLQSRGGEELRRRERRPDDRAGRQLHISILNCITSAFDFPKNAPAVCVSVCPD